MFIFHRQLDLAFNKIGKIRGLERLLKLKKLFLIHNKISKMENLEQLTQLEMLELGSNKIRVSGVICQCTELHVRYFLFLFIEHVYFAQEYIYHEAVGQVVYVFLHKINLCNK